ncbi:MAG: MATE family efflux transporter [Lachnospiraceae bacterium]|jgi:putative MATE family efflux protein|nr:MATE family efflux transporter [Lachnospiraceae bacterium]
MTDKSDKTNKRLHTVLDDLPSGTEGEEQGGKVSKTLPANVRAGDLYRDIVRIAWPSFVELILTQLASMVDLMMVGSIGGEANPQLGAQALTAVGLTTQPKFLLMAAFVAMNTGVTALVARYKGLGNREKANLVVRQGLMFTFTTTILLSALGVIFARPMVVFMGSTEEAVTIWATQYLQIQMAGFLTMALTSTITASLRGVGDSRSSMMYNMIANLVNVAFNWLLIYGNLGFPEWGVAGASLATVLGQLVAFFIALGIILRGNGFLKLEWRLGFLPDRHTLRDLLNIGIPAMIEQLLMRAGMIIFTKTVASLGTTAYATHQICMNIQALSFMTGQAFAVSSTTLMGQSLGKRRSDMAHAYCSRVRRIGMFSAVIISAVFIFFGGAIVALYNKDAEIVAAGARIMLFMAFLQPLQTSQFIIAGALRGAGDTRATAVITFVTVLLLRPSLAILLVHLGYGLYGAWIALACDQAVRSVLVLARYHGGRWKTLKVG